MDTLPNKEYYLICLINAALHGCAPPEIPESVNWRDIYITARRQSVANVIYPLLEKLQNKPEPELLRKWEQIYCKAVVKDATQQLELEHLTALMTENEIGIIPLKGSVVKKLYPKTEMREMGDIDILYDITKKDRVRELMIQNGYRVTAWGKGNHDTFEKQPVLAVELHRFLVSEKSDYREYFEKAWSRAEQDPVNPFLFHMKPEDLYIFMIAHSAKHFSGHGGVCIRHIMDLYVFSSYFKNSIKWEYIRNELDKIGLLRFCEKLQSIADIWFDGAAQDKSLLAAQSFLLSGDVYSNKKSIDANTLIRFGGQNDHLRIARTKYIFNTIFPLSENMYVNFPFIKNKPFLIPFFWPVRWVQVLLFRRKNINKLSNGAGATKSDVRYIEEITKQLGL